MIRNIPLSLGNLQFKIYQLLILTKIKEYNFKTLFGFTSEIYIFKNVYLQYILSNFKQKIHCHKSCTQRKFFKEKYILRSFTPDGHCVKIPV